MRSTFDLNCSIITNFGCNRNCWYCVWRKHPLKNINNLNLFNIQQFIIQNKAKGKISISGGGDPLFNFFEHIDFWKTVVDTCKEENMKLDIHTREKLCHSKFWNNINRCCFSVDYLEDDIEFLLYLKHHTNVRIYKTITKFDNENDIKQFIKFSNKNNVQLTFKQLYGHDDENKYNEFKYMFDDQFFLDSGDYNIYLMPDNSVTDNFFEMRT